MSRVNHGTIEVTAGDITYILKPTLRAFRDIERKFGGVLPAMQALGTASVSTVAMIIAAGSGVDIGKRKEVEAIEEAVFDAGTNDVGSQIMPFLKALLNPAGKTDAELEAEKEADAGNE